MERSYIGALLRGACLDGVGPADFLDPDLRQIFGVIGRLHRERRPVDTAIVVDALRHEGAAACGKDWALILSVVWDAPAVSSSASEYGRLIRGYAGIESLSTTLGEVLAGIESPGGRSDPTATAEAARLRLAETLAQMGASRVLSPLTATEILEAAYQPVQWTLKPLLTEGAVRILSGPGKVGKTTFAIAAHLACIRGGNLAGHFESEGGHTVAYFDGENQKGSWAKKYTAVCKGLGISPQRIVEEGRLAYFNSRGLYLDDPSTLNAVIGAAKKVGASEIVLDSLTRLHRQREADAVAMSSLFLDCIFRLRDEVVAGVTVIHHTRKGPPGTADDPGDALRGSSDLRNVVDTHLSFTRNKKNRSAFTLTVTAQRDAAEAGPFSLCWEWTSNSSVTFLPADPAKVDDTEPRTLGRRPAASQIARTVLREALAKDPSLTWSRAIELCEQAGASKSTAKKVWREVKGA